MNGNLLDDHGFDQAAMYYAQLHQENSELLARANANGEKPAANEDFVHPAMIHFAGVSEMRSWAVQPTASWREEHARETEDAPAPTRGVSRLLRWTKFNLVGAMGIAVQMAALFALKSLLHFNYLAATAFAVEAAVVHNFFWHERFTWVDRARNAAHNVGKRMLRFNLTTGGVSIVGNLVLMKLLAGMAHINYFAANIIAIALCSLANFVASDEWVFGEA